MGSSWQHNTVSGLNGWAHIKFLNWLYGKQMNWAWEEDEKTFIFWFPSKAFEAPRKEALRVSYMKRFRDIIKPVA